MPSIILSDNGVSSGSAGLKSTAASDGALALQTTTAGGTATTAVSIDTSQNVGVGTTPSDRFDVQFATGSGRVKMGVVSGNNVKIYNTSGDISLLSSDASSDVVLDSQRSVNLKSTNTTVATVKKDYSLALQGGTSSAGIGITFPASQSASTDVNTLDDYEEGTFSPVLNFNGGTTGITYQNNGQQGTFVKIGRFVTVTIYIYLSNKGSSTGTMQISGLPFASDSSSPNYIDYYFPLGARNAFTLSAGQFPFFYLGTGSSQIVIYYTSLTTGGQPVQVTNTAAANLLELSLQFTYRTAS